jgi:hypothetical protein
MDIGNLATLSLWMSVPIIIVGSLLHFLYDWSGGNRIIALISSVNESYWEHIKIAFWPSLLAHLGLYLSGGYHYAAFLPAVVVSLYSIPVTLVMLIWFYKNLTKKNVLWLDILVFALVIILAQVIFALLLTELSPSVLTVVLSAVFLVSLLLTFLTATFRPPPDSDLFLDPITLKYGMAGHSKFAKPEQ